VTPAPSVQVVPAARVEAGPSSGGLSREEAISNRLAGSEGIFMGTSRIAPGSESSAHVHTNCESALFVVAGAGSIQAGPRLEARLEFRQGDFIYVPRGAPHSVRNDGDTELLFVVARNTQTEEVADYTPA
jgi:uncharacterized RmlC-like cupin family protein